MRVIRENFQLLTEKFFDKEFLEMNVINLLMENGFDPEKLEYIPVELDSLTFDDDFIILSPHYNTKYIKFNNKIIAKVKDVKFKFDSEDLKLLQSLVYCKHYYKVYKLKGDPNEVINNFRNKKETRKEFKDFIPSNNADPNKYHDIFFTIHGGKSLLQDIRKLYYDFHEFTTVNSESICQYVSQNSQFCELFNSLEDDFFETEKLEEIIRCNDNKWCTPTIKETKFLIDFYTRTKEEFSKLKEIFEMLQQETNEENT